MFNPVTETVLYSSASQEARGKVEKIKILSGSEVDRLRPRMGKERLQDYVDRIISENPDLSEVRVAKRAIRLGHKLSSGFVSNVRTGKVTNVGIEYLKALAAGLGRPAEEVVAVAFGKPLKEEERYSDSFFASLWQEFSHLSPSEQKEMRPMLEMVWHEVRRRLNS